MIIFINKRGTENEQETQKKVDPNFWVDVLEVIFPTIFQ